MSYDEDLLVELIADGELSHEKIAEQVGISRRTVWRIANSRFRPDLQQKIADTVEGYRQATIRLAVKHMKPLLEKQIKTALEGDGETARKAREFLLKAFVLTVPAQAAKAPERSPKKCASRDHSRPDGRLCRMGSLLDLPPDLKTQVVEALGGPAENSAGVVVN